ncbi:MAG: cell surface protein SprA [Candidatus Marinimicrobia bacterium]|nr:cell surface protein SprA [Candidatus Neomarinimicrobiota bacterium]
MRLSIHAKAALIIIVLLNILFAESNDTTGVTFPIHYNWLAKQYTPIDLYQTRGMSLVSDDYPNLNRHLYKINLNGLKTQTYVDSAGNNIFFTSVLDDYDLYLPVAMSVDEYFREKRYQNLREKIRQIGIENTKPQEKKSTGRGLEILGAEIAGQKVALRVSGNITISGAMNNRETSTVASTMQEGKSTEFKIDQTMRFNIEGTIGDRISILVDQDSERSFDFENAMKIVYTGKEDEIVQSVQAGNISLSLPGTKFVTFSSKNSGLFGLKADLKLGAINLTTIASVEKGEKQKLSYEGGSEKTEIQINDYDYIRNKYYYLDETFRERMWPDFWQYGMFVGTNEIVDDFEVYKSVTRKSANSLYGTAYVDPNNPSLYSDEQETTYFEKMLEDKDYSYSRDLGYMVMNRTYTDEVIAVVYTIRDRNNPETIIAEYGDWDHDPADTTANISLKLIQPRSMTSDEHPCWNLMFRNVYYLGATNIDSSGFDVQIEWDGPSGFVPRDPSDGKTYLEKFGLDRIDAAGNPGKDDYIDLTTGLVRLRSGEMWVPFLHPFQYDSTGDGEGNGYIEGYNSSKMYKVDYRSRKNEIVEESKFRIAVKYENRSSVLQLGPMIMEGSEEVTLDGKTLLKGTDYDIEYMSGMLTLYDPMATSPNAKLDVKFEKNSFFQLKKKTILGARAQYDFGQDKRNFIGATGLYYSKSTVDDKVEVGYEPMANFVFDINGRIQQEMNFLTKGIDRLPLISTDKVSVVTIEGEVARVLPNPNTSNNQATGDNNGVAYIDDFEGSKRTISPVLTKSFWALSSPPTDKEHATEFDRNGLAAHTFWYIDYDGVSIKQIWPDKDIGTGASQQERNINPLYLAIEPGAAPDFGVSGTPEQKKQAWGGITYFFPTSNWDQSKTKFIDIWMKGTVGTMHVDMGIISEDQFPDNRMNTEDWYNDFPNDLYDDGEDIGLDKKEDEDETLVVRDPVTGLTETLVYDDEKLSQYLRSPKDPHLDNFNYKQGSTEYKYLRTINGTENNEDDGGSNHRPDLEDKNNNLAIDTDNNYRSVEIPLGDNNHRFVANPPNEYGWKLYRIPIIEFENANGFSDQSFGWENIQAFRIWLDGVETDLASIAIAKIEMVRNEWEAMGIAQGLEHSEIPGYIYSDSAFIPQEKIFTTTVKNTEENEDYTPPKDVKGEYDKVNQVQRKEQSLVLKIYDIDEVENAIGLAPGKLASAEKDLLEELSLINYKKMKMYITAENVSDGHNYIDGEKTPLLYFLRFGKGGSASQYFEIRQPIYSGWEYNDFEVDLDFMTSLKQWVNEEDYVPKNNDGLKEFWILDDPKYKEVRIYKEVKNGEYSGKEIIIYSTPAISRIKRMETGVINTGDSPVFGEVWLNELRLSEVRKDAGTAARASFAINLADLADFTFNAETNDADFHRVEEQPSSNATNLANSKTYNASSRLYLHKFFPSKWGLSIPVATTFNYSERRPKYLPGTDILAGDNPADSISNINQGYGFNTQISKRVSDFWLTKYTIDQMKVNFSMVHNQSSTKDIERQESEQYSAGFSYQIPFGRDTYFQIFKWAENIPLLKNYSQMKLYYLPEKFSYNMNTVENINEKIPRYKGDTTQTHIMSLGQTVDFGYKFTENVKVGYNLILKNNLDEIVDDKWSQFQKFKFGTNEDYQEKYSLTFNPNLFSWFKPQMTYSSQYSWQEPVSSQTEYIDKLANNNNLQFSGSLNIAQVFKSIYAPGATSKKSGSSGRSTDNSRQGAPRRNAGRKPAGPAEENKDVQKDDKAKEGHPLLDGIHKYLDKLNTISASYTVTNSVTSKYRKMGQAGLDYRLGFSQDPGLDTLNALTDLNNPQTSTTLSLRSGLDITKNIKATFSYSNTNTSSITQGVEKETIAEDYFPGGEFGNEGFPFPNWQLKVGGLEKIPGVDKIFKSFSITHGFSGKKSENYKDGELLNSNYQMRFSPLVSFSMKFAKDITSNFSVTSTKSITNGETGVDRATTFGMTADISYKRKGGMTIPLPFMENKRLDNNIDFTMNIEYNTAKADQKTLTMTKYSSKDNRMTISIKPRIGYSFTQKVTGGVFFQYQIQDDARIGERKNMNYGFDVNIAIRG